MEKVRTEPLPQGSPKITEIALGRTSVKVKTEATPASLKQIKELVNSKFDEYADKLQAGMTNEQLSILVAFNLAEELLKEQERLRQLKRQVLDSADRLNRRVEAHLQGLS